MDQKVQEFLQKRHEEEAALLTEAKQKLLKKLNLYDKVVVEKSDGYDSYDYDNEDQKYIFYKYKYPEITDEEYDQLLKYSTPDEEIADNNGEEGLTIISGIGLGICVFAGVIMIFYSFNEGFLAFISGVCAIICGLIQFWITKVFANISSKSTAIYKFLKNK